MNGETYQDERDYQMQLALSRREQQQQSRLEYLRERIKDEVKERAKQEAKKIAARVTKKAAQAVSKMLVQLVLSVIRSVVIFLVATPPGWVVDIVIVAIILSILVVTDAGGLRTMLWNYTCSGGIAGGIDPTGLYRGANQAMCDAEEWLFGNTLGKIF